MLRSRKSLPLLGVKSSPAAAPGRPSTSRLESWIGRSDSTPNGRPFFSWAMAGRTQGDLGVEAAGEHPLVVMDQARRCGRP